MCIFDTSEFNLSSIISELFPVTAILISSANIEGIEYRKQYGRSLIYNRKGNEPKFDP